MRSGERWRQRLQDWYEWSRLRAVVEELWGALCAWWKGIAVFFVVLLALSYPAAASTVFVWGMGALVIFLVIAFVLAVLRDLL